MALPVNDSGKENIIYLRILKIENNFNFRKLELFFKVPKFGITINIFRDNFFETTFFKN